MGNAVITFTLAPQSITWAMEFTGLSYDELLDIWNDAKAHGVIPIVIVKNVV